MIRMGSAMSSEADVTDDVSANGLSAPSVTANVTDHAPSVARHARNQRDYRARRKRGQHCVTIRLTDDQIATLEANGYLAGARQGRAIADAVELFIHDHLAQ